MELVNLWQKQLEQRARLTCQQRNQGVCVEHGKASFEVIENGVTFIKQHYLLDSNHCSYSSPVAKVTWSNDHQKWQFDIAEPNWHPYPNLDISADLLTIMNEIAKDPHALIW
ncbi:Protein of unknown function [Vibrio xiamenensis]|uniref:DUF3024 domain-containing protein n=1 Tax=Vibrio xiamenensis TaxID=861298 RepID=A0A1G8G723_9VIBR|nr:DUF3024 domain-containing protein [Vibrio xiamenensis]SDH90205.1 Protein of unknown function [Vibrio xiamenensis]